MNRTGRGWLRPSTLLLAIVIGGILWGGCAWRDVMRYRSDLAEIRRQIAAGRPGHAAQKLRDLLSRKPASDEAAYLLGSCEKALGRDQAAAAAWAQVAPSSPFASQAIQGRMELEIGRGRLAEAERLIQNALEGPQSEVLRLPLALGLLYTQQGRLKEAGRLIEDTWNRIERTGEASWERALILVRLHIRLRLDPPPIEAIRSFLDQAARRYRADDRVWLGRANLAIRAGSYDEAAQWLDACSRDRPQDVPVWEARLRWALATNQIDAVRQAVQHLPVAESTPARVHALAAWLAARRGDADLERRALERVIAVDPRDYNAWDRLTELAVKDGQADRAAGLGARKAEIHRLEARYRVLEERNQPIRDSAEMGRLADQLGERFEARAFLTVAVAVSPDRDDLRRDLARLNQEARASNPPPTHTLAAVLAPELDATRPAARSDRVSQSK